MKDKITRHNYEAYFLDYAEGNLGDDDAALLMVFLEANPDLREELETFAPTALTASGMADVTMDWSSLKMPASGDSANRELLYFKAVEGILTENDKATLASLIANAAYKKEYELWQKLKLAADKEIAFPGESLYRFGYEMDLSDFTFEHYLIARCEGLLTSAQNAELERFTANSPDGTRQLVLADKLRLQPARAVFFPDKEKLLKKEKEIAFVFWYRIAGVAAALIIAFALWTWYSGIEGDTQMAGDKNKGKRNTEKIETAPAFVPDSSAKAKKTLIPDEETHLEEWQMREPDELEIAATPKPAPAHNPERNKYVNSPPPKAPEPALEITEAYFAEAPTLIIDDTKEPAPLDIPTGEGVAISTTAHAAAYKTISEIAEEKLSQKLNLTEEERDALALTVAKRAAERAGNLLNTEFSKEKTVDSRGENLTYTLRVGSFKASHTKTR